MNTDRRFDEIWHDYLNNQLSPADYSDLMQRIKGGEHDEAIKAKIDELFFSNSSQLELPPQQVQEIMINIQLMERQTSKLISFNHPTKRTWWWAVACVLGLLAFSGWLFLRYGAHAHETMAKVINKVETAPVKLKGKRFIKLPDASFVILNENSELDYPDAFDGKTREVTLRGEAYFDIRHSSGKPFIVHTGNINTVVLGTAFNINAFPDQDNITVTVTRGKVEVRDRKKTYAIVVPNQQLSINTGNSQFSEVPVDAEKVVAWKSGCLVLSDITMEDAVLLVGNKYHVNISISDERLKKCKINATFLDQENLDQVLSVICSTVNASFIQQPNDQIIISTGDKQ